MREFVFMVSKKYNDKTVEVFLKESCDVTAALLRKLKSVPNGITADGNHIRSIDVLKTGQKVKIIMPKDEVAIQPEYFDLDILYEDQDLLAVNKPSDMVIHPTFGYEGATLAGGVVAYFEKQGEKISARPLNRLDRYTSGVALFAKNPFSAGCLLKNSIKEYTAVVHGRLDTFGTIAMPIRRKPEGGIQREVHREGKYSRTKFKSILSADDYSVLRVRLDTGRTHQIRVHLFYLGYSLIGDFMYGDKKLDEKINKKAKSKGFFPLERQGLHCNMLEFVHPVSKEKIKIETEPSKDMEGFVKGYIG